MTLQAARSLRGASHALLETAKVRYTMIGGRSYDAATGDEIGNRPSKRGRFWFEQPRQ